MAERYIWNNRLRPEMSGTTFSPQKEKRPPETRHPGMVMWRTKQRGLPRAGTSPPANDHLVELPAMANACRSDEHHSDRTLLRLWPGLQAALAP